MKSRFIKREPEASGIFSFYFEPEKPVRYIAGQFIELYLPHPDHDKRGVKRWFTLSSAPSDALLTITTRVRGEKGSSFKRTLNALEPGAEVTMVSPMGDFVLPKNPSIPLLFVAGGIGCTPFHSIIRELQLTGEKRNIRLLYTAHSYEEVAFRDTFEKLDDNFKIVLSDPPKDWTGMKGQLDADTIIQVGEPGPEHYIYISGPEPMVEKLNKDLKAKGITKRHIYTDFFPGYTDV
jgi:glycine betaine catabolism B